MTTLKLFLASGAVLVSAGLNAGQDNMSPEFVVLDTNGDGTVSIIEATGRLDLLRNWIEVDKNMDGKLETSEFKVYEQAPFFSPPLDPDGGEIGAAPH